VALAVRLLRPTTLRQAEELVDGANGRCVGVELANLQFADRPISTLNTMHKCERACIDLGQCKGYQFVAGNSTDYDVYGNPDTGLDHFSTQFLALYATPYDVLDVPWGPC